LPNTGKFTAEVNSPICNLTSLFRFPYRGCTVARTVELEFSTQRFFHQHAGHLMTLKTVQSGPDPMIRAQTGRALAASVL
jgi:hypothetical protein